MQIAWSMCRTTEFTHSHRVLRALLSLFLLAGMSILDAGPAWADWAVLRDGRGTTVEYRSDVFSERVGAGEPPGILLSSPISARASTFLQ